MSPSLKKALQDAIVELEQLHSYYARHSGEPCPYQGPDTCPAWAVIHALRTELEKLEEKP